MTNRTCSIEGCARPAEKRGWCGLHYLRWYKHGDAHYQPMHYTACSVEGCANPPRSGRTPLCEMHYYRIRRNGTIALRNTRRPDAKYRSAHARIERDRGKAANHNCIDCGAPARHWSYDHCDPDERHSPGGQPYSLDPTHYDPRCAPCHAIFDGTGANQYTGGLRVC